MGLIKELDVFVEYYTTETKEKRMKETDLKKIIKAVDTLHKIMEKIGY